MALTVPVAEIVESSKNPLLGKHESWGRVLLGDIATIQNGFPFPSSQFTKDKGMPLIRIRDVGADSTDTNYVGDYDPAFIVEAGDFLIGMDGDFNCARWRGPKGLLNQRVCRVILKSDIYHPKLLDYALPGYLKAINDLTSSVTVKHLSSKSIAEIPLPLPPLDQQKRIVAEIEKQFSRLDEAVANLKRVKANLKRYKAAVLKAAVEGRLVETESELARREGRSYETGAQLLQRILETRRSQWKGKGKYKEPAAPDTTDLPELPEGWVWASVDQLASPEPNSITDGPFGSNLKTEHYQETGPRVIRLQNIKDGEFADEHAHISPAHFERLRKHEIRAGDLVIASLGENPPRACIIPSFVGPAIVKADCIRFKPHSVLSPAYLNAALNCQPTRQRVKSVLHGIGRPRLSLGEIRVIALPIPPETEQQRIVDEIDRRLALVSEVGVQVDANLTRTEHLRQSVLTFAYSARLSAS